MREQRRKVSRDCSYDSPFSKRDRVENGKLGRNEVSLVELIQDSPHNLHSNLDVSRCL